MKLFFQVTGAVLAGVVLLVSIFAGVVGLGLFGLEWKRFFEPRRAEIERQVFEQTPSFVHGKAQNIARLRLDYERAASDAHRGAIRSMILHEASTIDAELLPADIRQFLRRL